LSTGSKVEPTPKVSKWAEEGVNAFITYGLTFENGYSNFQRNYTREEVAYHMVRILDFDINEMNKPSQIDDNAPSPFTDISDSKYKGYIKKANELGLISGTSSTTFNPKGLITRQEFCKMLYNLVLKFYYPNTDDKLSKLPLRKKEKPISDIKDIAPWANYEVRVIYDLELISGVGNNKIAPKDPITCEMVLKMLSKVFNQLPYIDPESEIYK
jgi:hypothetical protein